MARAPALAVPPAPMRLRSGVALAFAFAVGVTQVGPLRSPDLFWHLQLGRIVIQKRGLPRTDPLTYTSARRRMTWHEWGSQVLFAALDRAAGLSALRMLRGLLVALFLALAGLAIARVVRTPEGVLLGQLVLWIPLRPRTFLRPHLVGWVLAVLAVVWLGRRAQARFGPRALLGLFLITLLWANLHSSVLLLPALLGLAALEAALEAAWAAAWARAPEATGEPPRLARLLGLLRRARCRLGHARVSAGALATGAAVALAAALIQPSGLALLDYARRTAALNRRYVTEWLPLVRADVWHTYPEILLVTVGLGLATLGVAGTRLARARRAPDRVSPTPFPGALAALGTVALALASRRATELLWLPTLYVAAGISAALAARGEAAADAPASRAPASPPRASGATSTSRQTLVSAPVRVLVGAGIIVLAVALSISNRGAIWDRHALAPGRFPEAVAQFLGRVHLAGHLFHPDDWGGYLSYRLYPRYRTFLDGRFPLAGQARIRESHHILLRRSDAEALLDRHGVELRLEPTWLYMRARALDPHRYELAWVDPVAVLLLRSGAHLQQNRRALCRYYRRHLRDRVHAYWVFRVAAPPGARSPTDLPLAIRRCPKETPPGGGRR